MKNQDKQEVISSLEENTRRLVQRVSYLREVVRKVSDHVHEEEADRHFIRIFNLSLQREVKLAINQGLMDLNFVYSMEEEEGNNIAPKYARVLDAIKCKLGHDVCIEGVSLLSTLWRIAKQNHTPKENS